VRLVCVYAVAAALLIAFLRPRVAEAWAARKEKHAAASHVGHTRVCPTWTEIGPLVVSVVG
jgi:hypothetical protein